MRPNREGLSTTEAAIGGAVSITAFILGFLINAWTLLGQAFSPYPMTAGQWAYFFHIFTGAPLIGVLAFWFVPGGFQRRFRCGASLIVAEAFGLMVAGAFALVNYPSYPILAPHEFIAVVTTLPAILLPVIVASVSSAAHGMRPRLALPTTVAGLLLSGTVLCWYATVDEIDACLPIQAAPHQRTVWNDIAGSFLHTVGAKASQHEAERFAACVGLPSAEAAGVTPKPFQVGFWVEEPPLLRWRTQSGDPYTTEGGCIFVAEYLANGRLQVNRNCGRL